MPLVLKIYDHFSSNIFTDLIILLFCKIFLIKGNSSNNFASYNILFGIRVFTNCIALKIFFHEKSFSIFFKVIQKTPLKLLSVELVHLVIYSEHMSKKDFLYL